MINAVPAKPDSVEELIIPQQYTPFYYTMAMVNSDLSFVELRNCEMLKSSHI